MSHGIENLFSVRVKPWHGLGTIVEEAKTSKEAIELAGLNWNVVNKPIYTDGMKIPNYVANIRDSDNSVLGIVTNRYQIVQNLEAFDFTDSLLNEQVKYETAGSLFNGKKIWLLAKMPSTKILDDEVEPYICFTNTHDGSGAVRCIMTPVRVVCNNTLNLALSTAKRAWSTRHVGDIMQKLEQAKKSLGLANSYIEELSKTSDIMANTKISEEEVNNIVSGLFPINEEDSDRKKNNMKQMRDGFISCYFAPDIAKFMNTKWGVINAAADFADHMIPNRKTEKYQENNFDRILNGHIIVDTTMLQLMKKSV